LIITKQGICGPLNIDLLIITKHGICDPLNIRASIKIAPSEEGETCIHAVISFTYETEFTEKEENFSCDKHNEAMITLSSAALVRKGYPVIQSPDGADIDIVQAIVE
jgi:hypothetical protein